MNTIVKGWGRTWRVFSSGVGQNMEGMEHNFASQISLLAQFLRFMRKRIQKIYKVVLVTTIIAKKS